MSGKGLGTLIVAILAIIGGAFAATLLIRKKFERNEEEADFDSLDSPVDDEEFEHFFGDDDDEDTLPESDDEDEEEEEEQL